VKWIKSRPSGFAIQRCYAEIRSCEPSTSINEESRDASTTHFPADHRIQPELVPSTIRAGELT
jgi:hypothetical protein